MNFLAGVDTSPLLIVGGGLAVVALLALLLLLAADGQRDHYDEDLR